ncbi:MAG: shikimate dehydrogenase [Oscillospiraceae bacterium]|nr:shikimate dehydrogenase [Oscillospiraceae bacterium]
MFIYQYTLIGHPLGHSMSPWIHERLFRLAGQNAEYTLTDIAPEKFDSSMENLKKLRGFNVTIPYKTAVLPHLSELSEDASLYRSVNTVAVSSEGKLFGTNTDCAGFRNSIGEIRTDAKILLIGCGGVGRMMATECVIQGAELTIVERDLARANALAEELKSSADVQRILCAKTRETSIRPIRVLETAPAEQFDLLMNATPVGMYPNVDACPVSDEVIAGSSRVFDVIYNPVETQLIRKAKALGKEAVGGSAMLVWQAAAAQSYWNNTRFSKEDVRALVGEMEQEVNRLFPIGEVSAK